MIKPDKKIVELGKFYTWMESDGIARTVVKPDADIFLQDAKENTAVIETFYSGKKFPLIVDIRKIKSISPEAREHFTLKGRESVVKAYAMLLSSSSSRLIGNFFLSFHKPAVPVKLFGDEDEALTWLKNFIQQP
jgi:hypothetical protein